ncbi:hypothetical protein AUJ14_00990 [Candidatus Micrarchaeota archaeon CG1_02_55_22]|nr:MAG: hypothetical protein AUJ14_00990 [Candidatus Micrarchaeota archaeon CG1_02_55_22]
MAVRPDTIKQWRVKIADKQYACARIVRWPNDKQSLVVGVGMLHNNALILKTYACLPPKTEAANAMITLLARARSSGLLED